MPKSPATVPNQVRAMPLARSSACERQHVRAVHAQARLSLLRDLLLPSYGDKTFALAWRHKNTAYRFRLVPVEIERRIKTPKLQDKLAYSPHKYGRLLRQR